MEPHAPAPEQLQLLLLPTLPTSARRTVTHRAAPRLPAPGGAPWLPSTTHRAAPPRPVPPRPAGGGWRGWKRAVSGVVMRVVCVPCPCGVSQAAAATTSSRLQPGPHHRAPAPPVLSLIAGGLRPAPPRLQQQGQGSLSGGGCFGRCAVEPEDAVPTSAPSLNTLKCARASSQNTSENDCMELSLLITSQITIIIIVLHSVLWGITFGIGSRASSCIRQGAAQANWGTGTYITAAGQKYWKELARPSATFELKPHYPCNNIYATSIKCDSTSLKDIAQMLGLGYAFSLLHFYCYS